MSTQCDRILAYLQRMQALRAEVTLRQLASDLHYPEASVSAQLRHLRKSRNGGHVIRKRWSSSGCYFYTLDDPIATVVQPVSTISLDAQV